VSEARSPPETAGRQRPRQPLRRPAEATSGGRETSVVPGHVRLGAQNREGRPRSASCGASRERARYGCTLSFRVASVGQTHRALSPPKGRKASRRCKNASWKEAPHLSDKRESASSRRTGARVNDFPQRLPVARDHELRLVSLSDTTVGVLGSHLEGPHRSRVHEVLRLAGQARGDSSLHRKMDDEWQAASASDG
jgi:hypothetical protein